MLLLLLLLFKSLSSQFININIRTGFTRTKMHGPCFFPTVDKFGLKIAVLNSNMHWMEKRIKVKAPLSSEQKLFLFIDVDTLARHLRFWAINQETAGDSYKKLNLLKSGRSLARNRDNEERPHKLKKGD